MKQTIYIPHKSKKIPVVISDAVDPSIEDEGAIHIFCEEAGLDQDHLLEDLPDLLQDIPEMIDWQRSVKKETTIRLRVSPQEKEQITTLAHQKGHKSVSSYIRSVALV